MSDEEFTPEEVVAFIEKKVYRLETRVDNLEEALDEANAIIDDLVFQLKNEGMYESK